MLAEGAIACVGAAAPSSRDVRAGRHAMLAGLMQQTPLQISAILKFAEQAHAQREMVSPLFNEPIWRYDFSRFALRTRRLANALQGLGIGADDRVSSMAWNTHR